MSQQSESVLNSVLIDMARSFLQYVAEAWPWVSTQDHSVEEQVNAIAARQRQDVADIVSLLTVREHFIDFGSFPTEYTDLQFVALEALFDSLHGSQQIVCDSITSALLELSKDDDEEAVLLLTAIKTRQTEAAAALKELQEQLAAAAAD
ncbi:MAG: hypothetical protein GY758_35620 [Fuerstiella sp.]|jgi:hypothetical protein|nr:hypothetical protein [Fuerstiella sp.]MCP4512800.1 hypothetical protein [Fuerstiella sp.]MDG2127970.1 hypothetical protein [Fuerstiella sp.]